MIDKLMFLCWFKMRTNKLITCIESTILTPQRLLTSWNNAAICSIVLFSYCRHSVTGIEYGVLLHKRIQWFCTWNRCSSRISFISSKQTRAVANPSAKFAFDSLFPPLKLQTPSHNSPKKRPNQKPKETCMKRNGNSEQIRDRKTKHRRLALCIPTYSNLSMVLRTFCGLENGPYVLHVTPGKLCTVLYATTP